MRPVAADPSTTPPSTRSVVACLALILELDLGDVPTPPADHPSPWTAWRGWLAGRGLGLVPVLDPAGFGWPGPWLALLRAPAGEEPLAAVAFGVPPGLVWTPVGGPQSFADVVAGYVVAPAAPAAWSPPAAAAATTGHVESLVVAAVAAGPATVVAQATAIAGRGLEGDRYVDGRGTFSDPDADGIALTLVAAEALDLPTGRLTPEDARRNVVTRGVDLEALIGRRFRVGDVECLGRRRCEPCAHLQRLAPPGTLRGLVHRGGLRADVLTGGTIRVGDVVAPLEGP